MNLLLHSNLSINTIKDVNLILSPEFYWVRIFKLPLDSTKEVLKVLPSLFEEFIDIEGMSFYVKKLEDGRFLGFAYDEQKIIDGIKRSGLKLNQVSSVRFAQIEFREFVKTKADNCMRVDDICLSYVDDILVQIPLALKVNIDNGVDISLLTLSKDTLSLNRYGKYIEEGLSKKLSVIFIIFSLLIFFKVYINNTHTNSFLEKKEILKERYNMPATSIQAKSIIRGLTLKADEQKKIRDALVYILNGNTRLKATILSIEYEGKGFKLKFKTSNKAAIENYFKRNYNLKSISVNKDIVSLRVGI